MISAFRARALVNTVEAVSDPGPKVSWRPTRTSDFAGGRPSGSSGVEGGYVRPDLPLCVLSEFTDARKRSDAQVPSEATVAHSIVDAAAPHPVAPACATRHRVCPLAGTWARSGKGALPLVSVHALLKALAAKDLLHRKPRGSIGFMGRAWLKWCP